MPPFPVYAKSTLNQPVEESWIQESLTQAPAAPYPFFLLILGSAGLVLSGFPLLSWAWRRRPRQRAGSQRPGRREFARRWEETLKQLSESDLDIKARYESLDRLLRDYFSYARHMEARGLTGGELACSVKNSSSPSPSDELLLQVLERGERCRYGPDDPANWGPALREDLQSLKRIKL